MSASGTVWKASKVVITAGAVVFVVSLFATPQGTATITTTAVAGTAYGVGLLGGSAKYAGPGFQSGMAAAEAVGAPDTVKATEKGSSSWSLTKP